MKICPLIDLHMNIHNSLIDNSTTLETVQMSMKRSMDKLWYTNTHNGILINKKELHTV